MGKFFNWDGNSHRLLRKKYIFHIHYLILCSVYLGIVAMRLINYSSAISQSLCTVQINRLCVRVCVDHASIVVFQVCMQEYAMCDARSKAGYFVMSHRLLGTVTFESDQTL
jgi:hypothetical protein